MTKATHTPGPWMHRQHTGNDSRVIHDGTAPIGMAYELADARLISEAPAMLAALREFAAHPLPYCETDAEKLARLDDFMRKVRSEARVILARIDGEA